MAICPTRVAAKPRPTKAGARSRRSVPATAKAVEAAAVVKRIIALADAAATCEAWTHIPFDHIRRWLSWFWLRIPQASCLSLSTLFLPVYQ